MPLNDVLQDFSPISLEEMGRVRLMNRVDTKYVTTGRALLELLRLARAEYRVQETGTMRNMPYYTCYFDTPECTMFAEHQRGKKARQKIRMRVYENSGTSFVEIKTKNNKGRTKKKRVPADDGLCIEQYSEFVHKHSPYRPDMLLKQVENRFSRITLVNLNMTERLTIDTGLRFNNLLTGDKCSLDGLAIIELKRDGNIHSPVLGMLRELHIKPSGFSKYCIGMALTNQALRQNRLKPKIRMARRLCASAPSSNYLLTTKQDNDLWKI